MNDNMQMTSEEELLEIDLREIFFEIKRWFWLIAIVAILGGAIAFGVTKLFITPMYRAETSMLVLSKETNQTSLTDLQVGSQLTKDYIFLTTSRSVLEDVIESLELDMTYEALKNSITISNPSGTRIMTIAVEHKSPETALEIARAVTEKASTFIGDTMEVTPPKIIYDGELPTKKVSPSNMKNTAIGILLGGILSTGLVVLRVILDDTIKTEDDVEKHLGLPTLSVVPDRKDFISQNKRKKSGLFKITGMKQQAGKK